MIKHTHYLLKHTLIHLAVVTETSNRPKFTMIDGSINQLIQPVLKRTLILITVHPSTHFWNSYWIKILSSNDCQYT